jgi:hypothetical protein
VVPVNQPAAGAGHLTQEFVDEAVVTREVPPRLPVVCRSVHGRSPLATPILRHVTAGAASVDVVMTDSAKPKQIVGTVVAALTAVPNVMRVLSAPPLASFTRLIVHLQPVGA